MIDELVCFKVGVWLGCLITALIFFFVLGLYQALEKDKLLRFIREKKLVQQFEDYEEKNKFR